MTLRDLLSSGILLQSIGIVGAVVSNRPAQAEPAPAREPDEQRDAWRKEHKTQVIQKRDEGNGIDRIPSGTYGFTFAPAAAAPLFAQRAFHSFEMHKADDGTRHLIGFLTASEAQLVAAGKAVDAHLFPEPYREATELVCLPLDRVRFKRANRVTKATACPLRWWHKLVAAFGQLVNRGQAFDFGTS